MRDRLDLGELVWHHQSSGPLVGRQELVVFRDGFRGSVTGGIGYVGSAEATWHEIAWLKRIDQTVVVNGVTTNDAVWLHVGLVRAQTFVFCGKRNSPGAE